MLLVSQNLTNYMDFSDKTVKKNRVHRKINKFSINNN